MAVRRTRQSSKHGTHSLPRMLQDEELEFDVIQSWWGGEEKKVPVITNIQAFGAYLNQVSSRDASGCTRVVRGVCAGRVVLAVRGLLHVDPSLAAHPAA